MGRWWPLGLLACVACMGHIPAEPLHQAPTGSTFNRQGEYILGAGDTLGLRVLGQEELTGRFVISAEGQVSLPLAGFVPAAGYTTAQLKLVLFQRLSPFINKPDIAITVVARGSYKVYFSGEVRSPSAQILDKPTTLLQGITLAGGPTLYASGRVVLMRRDGRGRLRRFAVDYEALLEGGPRGDNFVLERGDVVHLE